VMFDSDQGKKAYLDCVPDYTITDLRDLLQILGVYGEYALLRFQRSAAVRAESWLRWSGGGGG